MLGKLLLLRIKLRSKFVILFLCIALLPVLLGMTITIFNLQNIEKLNASNLNQQIALNVAEQVEAFVEAQFGVLEYVSIDPQLFDQDIQNNLLEHVLFKSINFNDIAIVDNKGTEKRRENTLKLFTKDELVDRSLSPEFQAVKSKKRYLGPVYLFEGRPFFQIGVPVLDSADKFMGAVFGIVDARVMQDVVKNISETSKLSRVYILDENNIVIAHPDISDVLVQKDFSKVEVIRAIRNFKPADTQMGSFHNELGSEVLAFGVPVNLSFQNQGKNELKTDWMVVSEQTVSVAFEAVRQVTIFTTVITIFILLAAVFTALIFTGKIVGPVEQLYKASQAIARGNLDYRVLVATGDEIEDLAMQFNSMAGLIKNQIEELKKTDKLKDEFIVLVSHNLRTPLTIIKGYLSVIRNKIISDSKGKDYIFKIDQNVDNLNRLVDEMLYISSMGAGGMRVETEPTDICRLIQDVIEVLDILIKPKGLKVILNCPPNLPLASANKNRIHDVVVNLLDNAIKFSSEGGIIELRIKIEGDSLVTSVTDHGIGIDSAVLPTLFEKFHRGTDYLQYNYPGVGLGLYYCKTIIEAHHGKIWVESKQGVGSTFSFSLPISHSGLYFKTPG
ncbi:HAMP domain-containing protein [Candidatus Daviesbacteria bacterium]|nr:HAMP domain-containing protein [Candidatus Daviesbacteria bacterium]